MTDEEREILLKALAENKKKALKSKEAALKYLTDMGFLTKSGKLKAPYNAVCTPEEAV